MQGRVSMKHFLISPSSEIDGISDVGRCFTFRTEYVFAVPDWTARGTVGGFGRSVTFCSSVIHVVSLVT
jgi:hypothetical protein